MINITRPVEAKFFNEGQQAYIDGIAVDANPYSLLNCGDAWFNPDASYSWEMGHESRRVEKLTLYRTKVESGYYARA